MTDSASTSYTLSPEAYSIPILHAASHPSSTTTGLFLSSPAETTITHAIPLQHHHTSLTPYTELGLELATAFAESKGLRVVGIYICHEGDGGGLGRVGEKLLLKLKEGYGAAFGLVLDNTKLGNGEGAFNVYLASNPSKAITAASTSALSALPSPFTLDSSIPATVLKAVREGKVHRSIKDLDDHLEDSSVDWLENKQAIEALRTYLA